MEHLQDILMRADGLFVRRMERMPHTLSITNQPGLPSNPSRQQSRMLVRPRQGDINGNVVGSSGISGTSTATVIAVADSTTNDDESEVGSTVEGRPLFQTQRLQATAIDGSDRDGPADSTVTIIEELLYDSEQDEDIEGDRSLSDEDRFLSAAERTASPEYSDITGSNGLSPDEEDNDRSNT